MTKFKNQKIRNNCLPRNISTQELIMVMLQNQENLRHEGKGQQKRKKQNLNKKDF